MEALERYGNDQMALVWFGRWKESDFPRPPDTDDVGLKQFIRALYERKVWYVPESIAFEAVEV